VFSGNAADEHAAATQVQTLVRTLTDEQDFLLPQWRSASGGGPSARS